MRLEGIYTIMDGYVLDNSLHLMKGSLQITFRWHLCSW